MKKILIIAAMADVELNYLKKRLQQIKEEKTKICNFYIGIINNIQVILCDAKVGLINTAAATTLAIEKYHPDYIINQGCAGGFGKDVHKCDIVVGTECINITSMITKNRKVGEGCNLEDWELINFLPGEKDRLVPQKADEKFIDLIKKNEDKYTYGKVHYGVIGSGDIWNKECDRLIFLNEKYGILCEDMEGVAVYTVSNQYDIPVIDFRVISDNEILNEEYERNISYMVQEFTEILLMNFDI